MNIHEMQKVVYQNKLDKGFNVTNIEKEFCLIYGEMAEVYEAWRKKQSSVGEELADVAIYLLGLAEILGVDLGGEIEKKISVNAQRKYEVIGGVLTRTSEADAYK